MNLIGILVAILFGSGSISGGSVSGMRTFSGPISGGSVSGSRTFSGPISGGSVSGLKLRR